MKRLISFVSCLLLLASIPFCAFAEDQPERLIIAMINYETGAQNFSIEEAFSKHIRTQRLNIAFIRVNSLTACL